MSSSSSASPALLILAPDEPPAFEVVNPEGRSSAVLLCDHASNAVPRSLPELGRQHEALREHTGWDIGAARLSRRLSALSYKHAPGTDGTGSVAERRRCLS